MEAVTDKWFDHEIAACRFADARLAKRLRVLLERMGGAMGESIPLACQDWANTKAAYRFFSNDRVSEASILEGHLHSTRERFEASEGPILVLQDTTEFSFQREKPERIGFTTSINSGKDKAGRTRLHTVCGLLMHSSLAVTTDGLPLGLAAVKFWTRDKFKGTASLKKKINPTRVPIEVKESVRWLDNLRQSTELFAASSRCVHVGDRESDIYELYCLAQELGTHFIGRSCVDRVAGDGDQKLYALMDEVKIQGRRDVDVRDSKGNLAKASVEISYRTLRVMPPIGKQKRYPTLTLSMIHAREMDAPEHRAPIDWRLLTNLPVESKEAALEKISWYALRWKIEVYHKILKSGCRAEDAKLRTADRLVKMISVLCILSWRVFWITMLKRSMPDADPGLALTKTETAILDRLVPDKTRKSPSQRTVSTYLVKLARLGGYLARASDPPPGNIVMWRGLARLTDIRLGVGIAASFMGN